MPSALFGQRIHRLAPACLAALLLAGCVPWNNDDSRGATDPAAREVPLRVVEQGGRTLAFVPISIGGEGPYMFALDTGASASVVDDDIADRLDLPRTGEQRRVSGVLGTGRVPVAEVERWAVGDVRLAPEEVAVIDLGPPEGSGGLQGLLGSDVLSEFGSITVDYEDSTLRLPPG
jgi:Aspartyl protease